MNVEQATGTEASARAGNLALDAAVRTHRGRVRRTNEDAYLLLPPLFAVADGLGGLAAGEVASRLAVESLSAALSRPLVAGHLSGLLHEAHRRIREAALEDDRLGGMGTTCTSLLVADGAAEIAHVGDTRAYCLRAGRLELLTRDHSLAQELLRVGRLSRLEATSHSSRNTLTRALGAPGELEVDRVTWPLAVGDRLLLCSDGLNGLISDEGIAELLRGDSPVVTAEQLIRAALEAGGVDNVTALVLDVL